jgi:hypothetical protein
MAQILDQLKTSQLSLNGETPVTPINATAQSVNLTTNGLVKSQLDLNGVTPDQYLDKKPQ